MNLGNYEIDDALYNKLDYVWHKYSQSVLKGTVGDLSDFLDFISYASEMGRYSKLVKDILVSPNHYENVDKIKPLDRVDFTKTYPPLSLNEMKDIDSIVNAIQERIHYTGNIILGNSFMVATSTSIFDSSYIYQSAEIFNTKYSVFSERTRDSVGIFGCCFNGELEFCFDVKNSGRVKRSFSSIRLDMSSDIYYSSGVLSSLEVMFSFGIVGKKYVIGNRELSRDKYYNIKSSLLEQIRGQLAKNKRVPLLRDLVAGPLFNRYNETVEELKEDSEKIISVLNDSFRSATHVIFGKPISDIKLAEHMLTKRIPAVSSVVSDVDGRLHQVYEEMGPVNHRTVPFELTVGISEMHTLNIFSDLIGMFDEMRDKMIISNGLNAGNCKYLLDVIVAMDSFYAYKSIATIRSRYVGYTYWPTNVEYGFGLYSVRGGSHIVNVYVSKDIKRGFEVDNSRSCSDVYYCHNCEDVHEGMFSFNIKGKRNTVGNAELSQDKYRRIKRALIEQIHSDITQDSLKYDIYSLVK